MSGTKYKVGDEVIIRPGAIEIPATIRGAKKNPSGDMYVVYIDKHEPAMRITEGCILRLR
jgi:hypothetical protein